jgi:predicted enzyme related to lactoylglutathione lyase
VLLTRFQGVTSAATIYAKHLEPMATFYERCFGLEYLAEAPGEYRVLRSDAWTLSIVQVPQEIASTIMLSNPPARREEAPIKLSFEVLSIAVARATIIEHGGQVDEAEWDFRGFRHQDFTDPEGNVGQLRATITCGA